MVNTIRYVDSTAVGANNGTTWTDAFTTLAAAVTASVSTGFDFYVSSGHVENNAGSLTLTFKGVAATPDRVFSVNKVNAPPQSANLTPGANISAAALLAVNGNVYMYGCTFSPGTNGSVTTGNFTNNDIVLDTCKIITLGNAMVVIGSAGSNYAGRSTFINTTIKFNNAASSIQVRGGTFRWLGSGSGMDPTTTPLPNTLFLTSGSPSSHLVFCDGVDFTVMANKPLTSNLATISGVYQFVNCKLATGATFGIPGVPPAPMVDIVVTDIAATNYNNTRYAYQGTLQTSTTVYNNATDGGTPISWQVVSTANCSIYSPFECFDIVQWAPAGTYAASKVFLTSSIAGLTTADVWVDVNYLKNPLPTAGQATTFGAKSGSAFLPQIPQGSAPDLLTTGANWAVGAQANKYSLDIPSFTLAAAGYVRFRVRVGRPNTPMFIDPAVTIA